jgi:alpha-glucosidase (family GH31 glycosyl hydrolase)
MHYPTDDNVFNVDKTENQFIVGSSIMVTPVLEAVAAGVTTM